MLFIEYLGLGAKVKNLVLESFCFSITYQMSRLQSKSDENGGTSYIYGDTYFSCTKFFFSLEFWLDQALLDFKLDEFPYLKSSQLDRSTGSQDQFLRGALNASNFLLLREH